MATIDRPLPDAATPPGLARIAATYGVFQALSVLGLYAVTVNLPLIAESLALRQDQVVVVATAYLLGFSLGLPMSGRLIDRFGFVRTVGVGLVLFATASVVAALATSLAVLAVLRFVAGATSSVMAVSGALLGARLPGRLRPLAATSMSMSLVVVSALSPVVGGLAGEQWGWRVAVALPVLILVVGAPMLAAVRRHLPDTPTRAPIDLAGFGLAAAAIIGAVTALSGEAATWARLAGGAAFVAGLSAVVAWARRRPGAFVPWAVLRDRDLVVGALVGHCVAIGSVGSYLVLPLHLAEHEGFGSTLIGLLACVAALAAAVATAAASRITWLAPRTLLAVLVLLGGLGMALVGADGVDTWVRVLGVALAQTAYGGTHAIVLLRVQRSVEPAMQGIGIGTFQMVFYLGGATGSAVLASVLREGTLQQASLTVAALTLLALPLVAALRARA